MDEAISVAADLNRLTRYTEALDEVEPFEGDLTVDLARAVMAVADAEIAELRARERLLQENVARVEAERDRAREECGHEKAMRASQREEMMRYFTDWRAAEAKVARFELLHVKAYQTVSDEVYDTNPECSCGGRWPCDTRAALDGA